MDEKTKLNLAKPVSSGGGKEEDEAFTKAEKELADSQKMFGLMPDSPKRSRNRAQEVLLGELSGKLSEARAAKKKADEKEADEKEAARRRREVRGRVVGVDGFALNATRASQAMPSNIKDATGSAKRSKSDKVALAALAVARRATGSAKPRKSASSMGDDVKVDDDEDVKVGIPGIARFARERARANEIVKSLVEVQNSMIANSIKLINATVNKTKVPPRGRASSSSNRSAASSAAADKTNKAAKKDVNSLLEVQNSMIANSINLFNKQIGQIGQIGQIEMKQRKRALKSLKQQLKLDNDYKIVEKNANVTLAFPNNIYSYVIKLKGSIDVKYTANVTDENQEPALDDESMLIYLTYKLLRDSKLAEKISLKSIKFENIKIKSEEGYVARVVIEISSENPTKLEKKLSVTFNKEGLKVSLAASSGGAATSTSGGGGYSRNQSLKTVLTRAQKSIREGKSLTHKMVGGAPVDGSLLNYFKRRINSVEFLQSDDEESISVTYEYELDLNKLDNKKAEEGKLVNSSDEGLAGDPTINNITKASSLDPKSREPRVGIIIENKETFIKKISENIKGFPSVKKFIENHQVNPDGDYTLIFVNNNLYIPRTYEKDLYPDYEAGVDLSKQRSFNITGSSRVASTTKRIMTSKPALHITGKSMNKYQNDGNLYNDAVLTTLYNVKLGLIPIFELREDSTEYHYRDDSEDKEKKNRNENMARRVLESISSNVIDTSLLKLRLDYRRRMILKRRAVLKGGYTGRLQGDKYLSEKFLPENDELSKKIENTIKTVIMADQNNLDTRKKQKDEDKSVKDEISMIIFDPRNEVDRKKCVDEYTEIATYLFLKLDGSLKKGMGPLNADEEKIENNMNQIIKFTEILFLNNVIFQVFHIVVKEEEKGAAAPDEEAYKKGIDKLFNYNRVKIEDDACKTYAKLLFINKYNKESNNKLNDLFQKDDYEGDNTNLKKFIHFYNILFFLKKIENSNGMEMHYDLTDILKEQELVPNSNITPTKLVTNLEKELEKNIENETFFDKIKKNVIAELYKVLEPNLKRIYGKFKLLLESYEDYDKKTKEIGPMKSEKSKKEVYEKAEVDERASTKAKTDEEASTKAKTDEEASTKAKTDVKGGSIFGKKLTAEEKARKELGKSKTASKGYIPKAQKTSNIKKEKEPFVINEEIIEKISNSRKERLFLEKFRVTFNYNKIFVNKLLKDVKFVEYKKPKPKMANKYLEGALKYLVSYTSLFDNTRISLGSESGNNDLIKYKILSLIKQYESLEKPLSLTEIVIKPKPRGDERVEQEISVIQNFYYKYKYYSIFQNYLRNLNEIKSHEEFDQAYYALSKNIEELEESESGIKEPNDSIKTLTDSIKTANPGLDTYYKNKIKYIVKSIYGTNGSNKKSVTGEQKTLFDEIIINILRNNYKIKFEEDRKKKTDDKEAKALKEVEEKKKQEELELHPRPLTREVSEAHAAAAPAVAAAAEEYKTAANDLDEHNQQRLQLIDGKAITDAKKLTESPSDSKDSDLGPIKNILDDKTSMPKGKTEQLRYYIDRFKDLKILELVLPEEKTEEKADVKEEADENEVKKIAIRPDSLDKDNIFGNLKQVAEIKTDIIKKFNDDIKYGKEFLKNFDENHNYDFSSEFYDNLVENLFSGSSQNPKFKLLIKTLLKKGVNLNLNDDVIMGKKLDDKFIQFKPKTTAAADKNKNKDIRSEEYVDGSSSIVGVERTDDYFIQVSMIPLLKNEIDAAGKNINEAMAIEVKTKLARN